MKDNSIEHNFYKQLQCDIDRVDSKADRFRAIYYLLRTFLVIVGAAITIVSGWNGENFQAGRCALNSLLVLGVLSTVTTAFDALFQVETKKNTYRLMLVELREIRSEFVYLHDNNVSDIDTIVKSKLFPKYQSVMAYAKSLLEKDNDNRAPQ